MRQRGGRNRDIATSGISMLSRPLLTVHETAEQLRVKESTIRSWIRQEKLRAIKFGREWRIAVNDLERFLNSNANVDAND
jgi:excisionase family DNA binding protein